MEFRLGKRPRAWLDHSLHAKRVRSEIVWKARNPVLGAIIISKIEGFRTRACKRSRFGIDVGN